MKFEFSAGGIVFKREKNQMMILVVQHAGYSHHWGFPKGHIGDKIPGEKKEEAAVREVKEETGIDGEILYPLNPIEFWYVFEGEKRKKKVYFYIMKAIGGNFEEKDHEMQKVEWLSIDEVTKRLTHTNEKKLFQEALPRIQELANTTEKSA